MDPSSAHVDPGFTWTSAFTGGTFLVAIISLLGIIARQVNPWRKQTIDAEQKLREDLLGRVEKLERDRDRKEVMHAAERALDRHKINNLQQCLDAVLMVLEAAPDKTAEVVAKIKAMREAQITAEAVEKAAIHAAEIKATAEVKP